MILVLQIQLPQELIGLWPIVRASVCLNASLLVESGAGTRKTVLRKIYAVLSYYSMRERPHMI